jgi:hypothetical protein
MAAMRKPPFGSPFGRSSVANDHGPPGAVD